MNIIEFPSNKLDKRLTLKARFLILWRALGPQEYPPFTPEEQAALDKRIHDW
ncbi:hypothetical protein [Tardiphaga sp.]|uniref:hypothetical protein n=1 Tax=Tardiphaga sp. TaxID=1926292 RepID=UPI0026251D65|nr:hypothetical protein [Tardiphaga sp.]MDB5620769.1 hypothetical protein [Tardiphaga sp.]